MADEQNSLQVTVAKELTLSEYRLQQVSGFYPQNQEGYDYAALIAKQAKDEKDRLDGERKKITKPMRDALQAVQDLFMPSIRNYDTIVSTMKTRMVEYSQAVQAQQYKAALEAQQAYQQNDMATLAAATTTMALAEVQKTQGVVNTVRWSFKIVNPQLVPQKYLKWYIDEADIQKDVTEAKGQIQIPGVEIVKVEGVTLR